MKGLNQLYKQSQEQIIRSAELLANETNDWQVIQQYISNRVAGIKLNEIQEAKLKRYQFIYNQLSSGRYTESDIKDQLMSTFNIEQTQALKDIRDARELYSVAFHVNKQFEIKLQLELNRQKLHDASRTGKLMEYAALEKNRQKLLAMLPDDDATPAEEFHGHSYYILFEPELLGVEPIPQEDLQELLAKLKERYGGKINIPGLDKDITDIEIIDEESTL